MSNCSILRPESKLYYFCLPGLLLRVTGKARVDFCDSDSVQIESPSNQFHGEETYLDSLTYLLSEDAKTTLPEGIHEYVFAVKLPEKLPASIVEDRGCAIVYKVLLTICYPLNPVTHEEEFFVVKAATTDPYKIAALEKPIEVKETRIVSKLFFLSDNIEFSGILERTGFQVGDKIGLRLIVANKTTIDCLHIRIKFIEVRSFTYNNQAVIRKRTVEDELLREDLPLKVSYRERKIGNRVDIKVPKCLPDCSRSSIVQIAHKIKCTLFFVSDIKPLDLEIPIVIISTGTSVRSLEKEERIAATEDNIPTPTAPSLTDLDCGK